MKIKSVWPVLFVGLLLCNVIWATAFFVSIIRGHRADAEKAALTQKNARLQAALKMEQDSSAEFQKNVQAAINSQEIAGLYEWENPSYHKDQTLDLRSDGTGQFDNGFMNGQGRPVTWNKSNPSKINISQHGDFKIENGDLIDERGNRWLKVR